MKAYASPLAFHFNLNAAVYLPPPTGPKVYDEVMRNKPHDIYYSAQTSRPLSQARLSKYNDLTQSIRN